MGERFVRWDAVVRNFLFVDSMLYSFIGLCLIIAPHHIAQLIMKRHVTDGVHWHLLRCIGGQFLATACLTWRCTSAARSSLHSTCLLLRLLASMLSAFVFAHNQAIHAEFVETAIIRLLVWLFVANSVACLLLLLVNGWPKYERIGTISRWGNIFCQLDSVMAIMIGFGWTFSPLWLLHRQVLVLLDPSHQLCGQIIGVNFLTSYIISTYALNCGRREAFQMAAETRLIMIFYINLAQFWSQFFYHEHWSNKHFAGISVFITWTSIALVYRIYLWLASDENEVVMAIAQNGTTLANGSATHYYKKRT